MNNILPDLHNFSYPTQPHSLIANYAAKRAMAHKESGSRIRCQRVTMHVSNARMQDKSLGIQIQLTKLDN